MQLPDSPMPEDYSGRNLRGRSFRGQNLEGANFSYADIRSTDFSGAILVGANFSGVKAGLQRRWAIFLVLVSSVLMGVPVIVSAFAGALVAGLISKPVKDYQIAYQIAGWAVAVILVVFFFVTIRQGIQLGLGAFAFAFAFAIAVAFAIPFAFAIARAGAFAIAAAFAGAIAVAVAFAFAVAIAGAIAVAVAVAVAFVLFNTYIGWRALKGDPKQALIRNIAVAFAAFRGISFRSANLTDANFTSAMLKSTDFRKANLTRTSFHKSKKLDCIRPGLSYLQISEVRDCLVAGRGSDKNFDRLDLRGINFKGAILIDASFQGADLSDANLQDADLSRAKLVQAQLDGTDFTGATLTGTYIKDWNITSDTKFDGVRCEYVYMRFPTKENPDPRRKPDNNKEVFADGEFGDFIQPIFDTLDLYHNQGVDPRAIAISFKQLAENHPEAELEIVVMEKRGEDKLLLRAKTAPQVDKSELSAEYSDNYNSIKSLPERDIQLLLAAKDGEIEHQRKMIDYFMSIDQRPTIHIQAENYHNQGDTMSDTGRNINISGGTVNASGAGAFSLGDISGTVANTINQLPDSSDSQGIKELLTQLQAAIEADTNLPEDDKKEALEQVNTLAEAGKSPEDSAMQKTAKTAMKILKGTVSGLPVAATLADSCSKLLPLISNLLGLA